MKTTSQYNWEIGELKGRRAELLGKAQALHEGTPARSWTDENQREFDSLIAACDSLEIRTERLEKTRDLDRKMAETH